jgi:uncharacterized protein (DUF58 family)
MGNFIVFILTLFALAALLRIDFFFTILYLFVGVYILTQLWTRRMLGQLVISRHLQQRAFLGDRITVTLTFDNLSRLPVPWLLINEVFPVDLGSPPFYREVVTLGGKAGHTAHYTLTARKRGYYKIGPLTLQSGDLLSLKRNLTSRFEADYLIVYPKIIPIAQLGLPTHSPHVVLPTPVPLFQDPNRLIGVRDYEPGDNPRYIHWPATATTGQVLMKQFQPAIARENAIFLNLSRPDYAERAYPEPVIELAIIVAASLASHMITVEHLPVGLVTTAFDPLHDGLHRFNLPPRKERAQLMQILEILARVRASIDEAYFLETLRQTAVHLSWGTTAIIITSHETAELAETLLLLKRSGLQVTLVLVQSITSRVESQTTGIQQLGIPVFKIRGEKQVEVWSPVA